MKLTPASNAALAMRAAVALSVCSPNIMAPRQIFETLSPLLPSLRYSIFMVSCSQSTIPHDLLVIRNAHRPQHHPAGHRDRRQRAKARRVAGHEAVTGREQRRADQRAGENPHHQAASRDAYHSLRAEARDLRLHHAIPAISHRAKNNVERSEQYRRPGGIDECRTDATC